MKRIPEKFELSEDDIKAAIKYWIRTSQFASKDDDFDVVLSTKTESRNPPPGAPVGGMSDYSVQVVTATAEKK